VRSVGRDLAALALGGVSSFSYTTDSSTAEELAATFSQDEMFAPTFAPPSGGADSSRDPSPPQAVRMKRSCGAEPDHIAEQGRKPGAAQQQQQEGAPSSAPGAPTARRRNPDYLGEWDGIYWGETPM